MGGAIGKGIAKILRAPQKGQSHLIVSGAGAGIAAAFNAPLAGFIFVIEELQRELSPLTYGTAFIAAVSADIVTRAFTGQLPSFHIHGYPTPPLSALPLFAIVGLFTGLLGVLFNKTLLLSLKSFSQLKNIPVWLRVASVGAIAGFIAWWLPDALGGGHSVAEKILVGNFASLKFINFIIILFVVKFALTMISYGSGSPGGIFAPLLVLGAIIGLVIGQISVQLFPGLAGTPQAFAVLGMASFFVAIVRAPLTGIVLILEMTGNYEQPFALLVSVLVAYMVAEAFHDKPIYDALLELDLHKIGTPITKSKEPALVDVAVEHGSSMAGCHVKELGLPYDKYYMWYEGSEGTVSQIGLAILSGIKLSSILKP